jgi:hypothetical protein
MTSKQILDCKTPKSKSRHKDKPHLTALSLAIEEEKKQIALHRDKLRELVEDAEAILECCEQAEMSLEEAIDHLSCYL